MSKHKGSDFEKDSNTLKWLSIAAGTTLLIGVAGLLAIMSQSTWAAENVRSGFTSGAKTFTNPFGNTNAGSNDKATADDDSDSQDDLDFGDEKTVTPPPGRPGSPITVGAPQRPISMGGQPNSGVISNNPSTALEINSETGEGSKALVTDFNFPDADILDIAKTLGRLTGKNFIFDKDVKGRISLISNSPVTVGDAWRAFLTALDMAGFALIPSGKYLRIARNRDARDKQLKTYTGDFSPDTDALVTRIFSLKYINADEVARTFRSFMPANSRIMSYDQTNSVIVTDTGANIAKLAKMLEILDVEGYDAGIVVIPVKYASATELSKLIDQLIPGTGGSGPGHAPRFGTMNRFNSRRTKEGGVINTIIADERTNTLIVHANEKGAEQVRELVAKLDQKLPAATGGGKLHVVYLQFADAEAIATTLNNLSQQATGFHPPTGATGSGTGTNPVGASLFEGNIKISPDKATNSLVVTASEGDFATLQRVINRLDIPRDEVFVETVMMEVSLNKTNTYSANVASPSSGIALAPTNDLYNFIQNPIGVSGMVLGFKAGGTTSIPIGQPGSGQSITVSSVQGLINALASTSKTNILATPQIIALDNSEATFESAQNLPVLQSTAVPNAGVTQTVSKERVALSMKIKPQINKLSNFVKLDVEIKNGQILNGFPLPAAVQQQAYATQDRTAKTTVVVADSDTVVIGGLISDNLQDTVNKIPILGDIPILGWLFKSSSKTIQKSNLLVFLTPHIVRQYEKVRAILDRKLKERDEFIEQQMGGDDPLRPERNNIIRSLPDLKKITQAKPQTTVTIDEDQPAATEVNPGNPFTGGSAPSGAGTNEAVPPPPSGDLAPPPPPAN